MQLQPPGEPRKYRLGEGRNPNLILYNLIDSSVFLGSGFHNPNYLEIKKYIISTFLAPMFQNISIGNIQTFWSFGEERRNSTESSAKLGWERS